MKHTEINTQLFPFLKVIFEDLLTPHPHPRHRSGAVLQRQTGSLKVSFHMCRSHRWHVSLFSERRFTTVELCRPVNSRDSQLLTNVPDWHRLALRGHFSFLFVTVHVKNEQMSKVNKQHETTGKRALRISHPHTWCIIVMQLLTLVAFHWPLFNYI